MLPHPFPNNNYHKNLVFISIYTSKYDFYIKIKLTCETKVIKSMIRQSSDKISQFTLTKEQTIHRTRRCMTSK